MNEEMLDASQSESLVSPENNDIARLIAAQNVYLSRISIHLGNIELRLKDLIRKP